jgi:cold shock CspA family protein
LLPVNGLRGSVIHWDPARGFGFVRSRGAEFFCHRSDLLDVFDLEPGALVVFDGVEGPKGLRAEGVAVIAPPRPRP